MNIFKLNIRFNNTVLVVLILVISFTKTFSQQLPLSSQFMFNKFLVNPAATGSSKFMEVRLNSRKQWVGIKGGPTTNNLSVNKLINNRAMGLGASIFSDTYGPESKTGFKISYSYILPLSSLKSNFAMGLAFYGFQYTLDYNRLYAHDVADPTLQTGKKSIFVPDADFGIYLYNKKYTFGISSNQLINLPIDIDNTGYSDNSMIQHYYIMGSYITGLSESIDLETSALLKTTLVAPLQVDLNFRFIFTKKYWLSVTYRTKTTLVTMIGINYNNFVFGYAYDYYFSDLQNFQSGSHEIILGYNFGQLYTSNSLLNSLRSF